MRNKFLDCTALTVAIIGAINWGLIGFFRFDLVAFYLAICLGLAESFTHSLVYAVYISFPFICDLATTIWQTNINIKDGILFELRLFCFLYKFVVSTTLPSLQILSKS